MALENWKPKGSLCDDHIHVPISKVIEMDSRNYRYKMQKELKKIANNPMFSDEMREAAWFAINRIEWGEYWRNRYFDKLEEEKGKG